MLSSRRTAAPSSLFRAAIPPKTLEVMRHSDGARWSTSPKGPLRLPRTTRSGGGFDDVAAAVDGVFEVRACRADQLGHEQVSMTTGHYFGRRVARTGAAEVLDPIDTSAAAGNQLHG